MGVPTSEVGYTIATTRRETTKVPPSSALDLSVVKTYILYVSFLWESEFSRECKTVHSLSSYILFFLRLSSSCLPLLPRVLALSGSPSITCYNAKTASHYDVGLFIVWMVRKFVNIFVPLWCSKSCSREQSFMEEDPVDQLQLRYWNSDMRTEEHTKGFVGNLQRTCYHVSTDRQTRASLLTKRYNSCRVLAFSTIFFHSRRSWASSDHLVIFIFLKSFLTSYWTEVSKWFNLVDLCISSPQNIHSKCKYIYICGAFCVHPLTRTFRM